MKNRSKSIIITKGSMSIYKNKIFRFIDFYNIDFQKDKAII